MFDLNNIYDNTNGIIYNVYFFLLRIFSKHQSFSIELHGSFNKVAISISLNNRQASNIVYLKQYFQKFLTLF